MTPKPKTTLEQTIEKAQTLIEALPYIQRFRDTTVVIKLGGRAMIDATFRGRIARDIVMMESFGIHPILVHGGGPEISAMMERVGLKPQFHKGQRITDAKTLEITEMILTGKLGSGIVTLINQAGGRAVGLSGRDGGLILARKHVGDSEIDMGFVGDIEEIKPEVIDQLKNHRFIPVISPIGVGHDGQAYNINADAVASAIAIAAKARKLVLLTDQRGILRDPDDEASLIRSIKSNEIEKLIADGVINGGMIPKVKAGLRALESGVRKTHILDGRMPHSLLLELFTDEGIGTEIQ